MQTNDFSIASPLVDVKNTFSFDDINIQSSEQFDSQINSILLPTINIVNAEQLLSTNEEFNDSLESHSDDFNEFVSQNHSPESNTMEQDSLESIENNALTTTNTFAVCANTLNVEETLLSIAANETNKITNKIPETNITKSIDTECTIDSDEYDLKDIPGIKIANNEKTNKIKKPKQKFTKIL